MRRECQKINAELADIHCEVRHALCAVNNAQCPVLMRNLCHSPDVIYRAQCVGDVSARHYLRLFFYCFSNGVIVQFPIFVYGDVA